MSGLFWWSPEITSIFQPLPVSPESSTAIWAASVEPGPPRSAYRPDWSDSAPILTTLSSALAVLIAANDSAVESSREATAVVLMFVPLVLSLARLDAEIGVQLVHMRGQLAVGKAVDDLAVLDDVVAVGDGGGEAEILLDQKDGETLLLEPRDGVADLLDDDGRKPFGRLVQHQEARAGAQDAGNCQHLLLAAGELGALALQPLLQVREQIEDLVERQPAGTHHRRQQKVLAHVEACEDAALLRAEGNAEPRDPVGGRLDQLVAIEAHRACALADHAHDRLQRGGLAGAIAPKQRHHLAGIHIEIDAVKDVGFAVPGLEIGNRQDLAAGRGLHGRLGHLNVRHDRLRDRLP